MLDNNMEKKLLFCDYYKQWIDVYKKGAIREATMAKYRMTLKWVEKLVPELGLADSFSSKGRNEIFRSTCNYTQ